MRTSDQARWDERHSRRQTAASPAKFLCEIIDSAAWSSPRGRALDIACGKGRNAIYLAERGFTVVGVDISSVALAEGQKLAATKHLSIDWQQADLEGVHLDESAFELIVNINYLRRPLIAQIKRAVKIGGHVVFETFLIDQKTIGHPSTPDFLLGHNELIEHFEDFRVLYYREGMFSDNGEKSYRAGILAERMA